jgi:hypothetical protein
MITSAQRQAISPSVTRHFAFTRLQDQFITRAYQALIPVVSRPVDRPRTSRNHPITAPTSRSRAGGV